MATAAKTPARRVATGDAPAAATYVVRSPLHFDGEAYAADDEVQMDERTAAPLLDLKVIEAKKAG